MNSVELFYQIFTMRYSMDDINKSFVNKYKLGFLGSSECLQKMQQWIGEPTLCSDAELPYFGPLPSKEEPYKEEVASLDLIVCHLGTEVYSDQDLRELVDLFPANSSCLFIYSPRNDSMGPFEDLVPFDATLPSVKYLSSENEQEEFAHILFDNLPNWELRLARDYSLLREVKINSMILSKSNDLAMLAAASSITTSVPVIGPLIGFVAVSAETLVITASQIRLALIIGALYGRSLDFFDRLDELWPVVGGAWCWRTLAREFVGLMPGAGPLAKACVAWSGTYMVGFGCKRFYQLGEHMPKDEKQALSRESREKAMLAVRELSQDLLGTKKTSDASEE